MMVEQNPAEMTNNFGLMLSSMFSSEDKLKGRLIALIRDTDFLMLVESNCSVCKKAEKMLKRKKIAAFCTAIDRFASPTYIKNEMKKFSGSEKFPQIFIQGEYFGGIV
jgi:glutaredoxin